MFKVAAWVNICLADKVLETQASHSFFFLSICRNNNFIKVDVNSWIRLLAIFHTRQTHPALSLKLEKANRLIYQSLTWQDACDSVQGSITSALSLPDIRCMILLSWIPAGLSCQEAWQIVCLGKAFATTTNSLSVCICVCLSLLVTAGVGVYPQQEHIQPMLPAWVYNDSLVPGKHLHMNTASITL